jgi:hypothetical protein
MVVFGAVTHFLARRRCSGVEGVAFEGVARGVAGVDGDVDGSAGKGLAGEGGGGGVRWPVCSTTALTQQKYR